MICPHSLNGRLLATATLAFFAPGEDLNKSSLPRLSSCTAQFVEQKQIRRP